MKVDATIGAESRVIFRCPLDVAVGAAEVSRPPVEAQPGSDAGLDFECRGLDGCFGFVKVEQPTAVVDALVFRANQFPAGRGCRRGFVTGDADGAKVPADAAGLHPSWERPPSGVGGAIVLLGCYVAVGVDLAACESARPANAHLVKVVAGADCRPECGVGEPFVPQRNLRAGSGPVDPEQLPQRVHFSGVPRDDEPREVVGDVGRGCSGCEQSSECESEAIDGAT